MKRLLQRMTDSKARSSHGFSNLLSRTEPPTNPDRYIPQPRCHLLVLLPGELRNLIWSFALVQAQIDDQNRYELDAFPLAQCCRQIRRETLSLKYSAENLSILAAPDGRTMRRHARDWLRLREADGLLHVATEALISVGVSLDGTGAVVLDIQFHSPPRSQSRDAGSVLTLTPDTAKEDCEYCTTTQSITGSNRHVIVNAIHLELPGCLVHVGYSFKRHYFSRFKDTDQGLMISMWLVAAIPVLRRLAESDRSVVGDWEGVVKCLPRLKMMYSFVSSGMVGRWMVLDKKALGKNDGTWRWTGDRVN